MSNAYLSTYSYECELAFNSIDGSSTTIDKDNIKYITIEHDFDKNVMPIIYIKVNLKPKVYNKMVPEQERSKIYLKLYRVKDKGATSSTPKKVIYDEFDYFMTDDPDTFIRLDEMTSDNPDQRTTTAYKTCLIGLMKLDLQKYNQKSFEGVFKNTNTMSLVQSATKNMKMVIQPFDNNSNIDSLVCPPIPTIGQFISYINSKYPFYKGSYVYYMDFDKTYLRSNDGSYIDARDGDYKIVAFDIRDLSNMKALTTGVVEDPEQDAYIIYSSDAQIIIDRVTSTMVNSVSTIDTATGVVSQAPVIDTSKITNVDSSKQGLKVVKSNKGSRNANNISTILAENCNTLIVSKIDIDSKVFTLNKQYLLANYEINPKYCGVYYLTNKKEIYLRNGDKLACQVTLTLKKCADFVK